MLRQPSAFAPQRWLHLILFPRASSPSIQTRLTPGLQSVPRRRDPPTSCVVRQSNYLTNLVEQDHRCLKRLVTLAMDFLSLESAWRTVHGDETMQMLRKGQIRGGEKRDRRKQMVFIASLFGVAISAEQERESSRPQHSSQIFCNTTRREEHFRPLPLCFFAVGCERAEVAEEM